MAEISDLPIELLELLFTFCGASDLLKCRCVCNSWKSVIDSHDVIWRRICAKDFKHQSKIAKEKSGDELSWFQLYRNLKKWPYYKSYEKCLKKFYHFTNHNNAHALEISNGVLALRESKGVILYDMKSLKYIPVTIPEQNCQKISNGKEVTVVQIGDTLFIQKNVNNEKCSAEAQFKAEKYVLNNFELFYFYEKNIFKVELNMSAIAPKLLHKSDYDLREMQYSYKTLHIFTVCGNIISIDKDSNINTTTIKIPDAWIKTVQHLKVLDDKNYICYNRNFFQITAEDYYHLYVEFPLVTASFFYGDVIIMGTRAGEILFYWVKSQKSAERPVFEIVSVLPEGKFAVTLDVYERYNGPTIVISTFFNVYLLDITFTPVTQEKSTLSSNGTNKMAMYKRLLKMRDRIQQQREIK